MVGNHDVMLSEELDGTLFPRQSSPESRLGTAEATLQCRKRQLVAFNTIRKCARLEVPARAALAESCRIAPGDYARVK